MQSTTYMRGYDEIIDTYDKETMEQIAGHGCSGGVCFKHIYYGDTVRFYDNYEDEITDYFRDEYGTDFLVELFKQADGWLTQYKNSVTWAYIEAISMDVISEADYNELLAEETESLLQPV